MFSASRKWGIGLATALSIGVGLAGAAYAQDVDYPTKSVNVIVPYGAGGAADVIVRIVADQLSKNLGQTFVIENKVGAGGTLGNKLLVDSAPDGYTLGLGSVSSHATQVTLRKDLPYDPQTDFTPIILIASVPNVMVVNSSSPAHSMNEFIQLAKDNPDTLKYGASPGSSQHLGSEMFQLMTETTLLHIPYTNPTVAVTDLINGNLDLLFENLSNVLGQIQAGELRVLAVSTDERWPELPDVATVAEQGYPEFNVGSWVALFGPAGMPEAVTAKLNAAINEVLQDPAVRARLMDSGNEPQGGSVEDVANFVDSEIARWKTVIEHAGIQPN